jgi:hypothetical protein
MNVSRRLRPSNLATSRTPGFVRVVLVCRACGAVDVCDLQPRAMFPERLRAS